MLAVKKNVIDFRVDYPYLALCLHKQETPRLGRGPGQWQESVQNGQDHVPYQVLDLNHLHLGVAIIRIRDRHRHRHRHLVTEIRHRLPADVIGHQTQIDNPEEGEIATTGYYLNPGEFRFMIIGPLVGMPGVDNPVGLAGHPRSRLTMPKTHYHRP